MNIIRMKTNGMENPIGFRMNKVVLSWVCDYDAEGTNMAACHVEIAMDEGFKDIIFDSGKSSSISAIAYEVPIKLEVRTKYYWRVKVFTDDKNEIASHVATFETAKMDEMWAATPITGEMDKDVHPLLRKEFELDNDIESARIYITGLGLYELNINGKRVSDEYFAPFCNAYDKWIQYQSYDVTEHLTKGKNAIGVMLGNGWYKGRIGLQNADGKLYGDTFSLLAELRITYKDGSHSIVVTDNSWKSFESPITFDGIYDGEIYDANKEVDGYSCPNFDDSKWYGTTKYDFGMEKLSERLSVPVTVHERLKPIKLIITPKGERVLDLGQNMVGWMEIKTNLPKDARISLYHGEVLDKDGNFYSTNLRSAKAEFHYISAGKEELVRGHFSFYGFRFVKVEGIENINLDDFTGCVIHSQMERTGFVETSNPRVNRLFENTIWGQKGNFLDVPTDCPQRDERLGWTGDAQVFSGTACFNMHSLAFFRKYLYDLAQEQTDAGVVPMVIPTMTKPGEGGMFTGCSAAWGDAATVIPWETYVHFGDKSILEEQFDSMKGWVDYIYSTDDGSRLWNTGFHFGDWLAQDNKDINAVIGATPVVLIASAYYAYSAQLVAKAANVIGKDDEATKYQKLCDEIKDAIQKEFITASGRVAADTQTANIVMLFMDLMKDEHKERVAADLALKLAKEKNHLTTGFVGTPYLCRVLSDNGYNDVAFRLLMNDGFPSWLYAVDLDATTIWERWNGIGPDGTFGDEGMNSFNHYSYGSICEWMYRAMIGINPIEDYPGFAKINLEPKPYGLLRWAKSSVNSPAGKYESAWSISDDNKLTFDFTIPFNAEANLMLPDANIDEVYVNGKQIKNADLGAVQDGKNVTATLVSGKYTFTYTPTISYVLKFSLDTNALQVVSEPRAAKLLPGGNASSMIFDSAVKNPKATFRELISGNPMFRPSKEQLEESDKKLKTINGFVDFKY